MVEDKILEHYTDTIETDKYTLKVETINRHWAGDGGGSMDQMPGDFMRSKISLESISGDDLSPIEQLAMEYIGKGKGIVLSESRKKEVTSEPKGYTKLVHDDFVEKAKLNPNKHVKNLRGIVKKLL